METPDCRFVHESKIYECTDHITDLLRVTAELALEIIMNSRYEVQFMYQIVSCSTEVPSEHLQAKRTAAFTRVMGADQHSNITNVVLMHRTHQLIAEAPRWRGRMDGW